MRDILQYSELQLGREYYFVWKYEVLEGRVRLLDEQQKQVFVEGRIYDKRTGIVKPDTSWIAYDNLLWCYEKSTHELYDFVPAWRKTPVKEPLLVRLNPTRLLRKK